MHVIRAGKVESNNDSEQLRALLAPCRQPFPHQLASRFPHVVKRILSVWQTPDKARTCFRMLLAREQEGVQGFPLDVYQEIHALAAFYDKQFPASKDRRDIWAGFST